MTTNEETAIVTKAVTEAVAAAFKRPEVAEAVRKQRRQQQLVESFDYDKLTPAQKDEMAAAAFETLFRPGGARAGIWTRR